MPCELCGEAVTHPIGASRIKEQVATWLREKAPEALLAKLGELHEEVRGPAESWCIFTGEETRICSHCVTKRFFSWILREAPELAEEFLTLFTFADERPWFLSLLPLPGEKPTPEFRLPEVPCDYK